MNIDSMIEQADGHIISTSLLIKSTKEFIQKYQSCDSTSNNDQIIATHIFSDGSLSVETDCSIEIDVLNSENPKHSNEITALDPLFSHKENISNDFDEIGDVVQSDQTSNSPLNFLINSESEITDGSQDILKMNCSSNINEIKPRASLCCENSQMSECQYAECCSNSSVHSSSSVYSLLYVTSSFGERPAFDDSIFSCGMILFDDNLKYFNTILFFDFNASYFAQSSKGLSSGVGFRYTVPNTLFTFGLNSYFDYSDASKYTFRQMSVGLEIFKSYWFLAANVYFPIGESRADRSTITYDDYEGDYIVTADSSLNVMKGIDFELGRYFSFCDCQLYPFIGGYYLSGSCCSNLGCSGGVLLSWNNMLSIEGRAYYDKCNQTTGELKLSYFLPICLSCRCKATYSCEKIFMKRTRRRNYIPYEKYCHYETNY